MSPDELRSLADTVSFSGRKDQRGEYEDAAVELRKLADVIDHAERWEGRPPSSPYALGLRDAWRTILRIARGEFTSNEDRSAMPDAPMTVIPTLYAQTSVCDTCEHCGAAVDCECECAT